MPPKTITLIDPLADAKEMLYTLRDFMQGVELGECPFNPETRYVLRDMLPSSWRIDDVLGEI